MTTLNMDKVNAMHDAGIAASPSPIGAWDSLLAMAEVCGATDDEIHAARERLFPDRKLLIRLEIYEVAKREQERWLRIRRDKSKSAAARADEIDW